MPNEHGFGAMDFKQIRCFTVVAQEGNITRAAARLHITQPALSRQIHALEEQLGVQLIERAGRGIRLTHAGELLLPRCKEVISQGEGLRDLAHVLGDGTHYELRIGSTPHFIDMMLADVIEKVHRHHPGVTVVLTEAAGEELRVLLEHNDVQLAVPVRQAGVPFNTRLLPAVPLLVLAPPGHPLRARSTAELGEVAREPLLLFERGFLTREVLESACQLAQLAPTVRHESGSARTLLKLAGTGFGVAVLPATIDTREGAVPLVQDGKAIRIDHLSIAWNPHAHLSPAARDLVDGIESAMRERVRGALPRPRARAGP